MTRFEAFLLLRRRVRDRQVVRRCLAVEALLEDLAARFCGDPARWGLAGLLHEVDFEFTGSNPDRKGAVAAEIVRLEGGPPEVATAIERFRQPGPHSHPLTRALSAAVPAISILLELTGSRDDLQQLKDHNLAQVVDDPSVAPEASRTGILALQQEGMDAEALLRQAKDSLLRVAEDVYPF